MIHDKNHFKNANAKSMQLGHEPRQSFKNCMKRLVAIRNNRNGKLYIYPDFIKHSFEWLVADQDGNRIINGGVILHGFEETFSIELSAPSHPHWSVHT